MNKLEYISTEDCEEIYIDGVESGELSVESLVGAYKTCMDTICRDIQNKSGDSLFCKRGELYEFITDVLDMYGEPILVGHCEQCFDYIYDHKMTINGHTAVYTEGCTCYGLSFDGKNVDIDDDKIHKEDVIDFVKNIYTSVCCKDGVIDESDESRSAITTILMEVGRIFGEFDEDWCDENNTDQTYNEKYVFVLDLNDQRDK